MEDKSKIVEEKIRKGEINFDVKPPKQKKMGVFKRIISWPFRMALAMFGIDIETLREDAIKRRNKY